jgi:AbiV family abortive infection protein
MKTYTLEQLNSARIKSLENAEQLLKDAELCFLNKRWSTSFFLSQISGEEVGKYLLVINTIVQIKTDQKINWERFNKRFTSHSEKQQLASQIEDLLLGQSLPENVLKYFENIKVQSKQLDKLKQLSLYCDFLSDFCIAPSDVITEKTANDALHWAKGRYQLFYENENEFLKTGITDKLDKESYKDFMNKMD